MATRAAVVISSLHNTELLLASIQVMYRSVIGTPTPAKPSFAVASDVRFEHGTISAYSSR